MSNLQNLFKSAKKLTHVQDHRDQNKSAEQNVESEDKENDCKQNVSDCRPDIEQEVAKKFLVGKIFNL
jgi:hypothetical protein